MNYYYNNGIKRCWRNVAQQCGALLLITMLLAGCGRSDQSVNETTPQPAYPAQDAAVAPAPDTTAERVYPGPDASIAPEYVNPNVIPDKAYPAPPTVTPVPPAPTDNQGFVDYPSGEIGVIIDARNNEVVEVLSNSSAQAAGIEVGDVITQVEDKAVGDKFKDAKQNMGDKLHKQVKIEIERQGKKRTLEMKTDVLIFPTVAPDQPTPTPVYDPFIYL